MAKEFIESAWLYKTTDTIDFIKETQEKFVNIEAFATDESSAKIALIRTARQNDSGCNVVFDASWLPLPGRFALKGKSVRARLPS